MKLKNPFSDKTRNLFLDIYACMDCGRSDQFLELHHITGRDSNSPFNAIALCKVCHDHVGHGEEEERTYFETTYHYLKGKYTWHPSDDIFLLEHKHLMKNADTL